jgi:hypothetical protein
MPRPFVLLAGGSTNITLCTIPLTCHELPFDNTIMVTASLKPDSAECATASNGVPITVTSECSAMVDGACGPRIEVIKEVACAFTNRTCGTFGSNATNVTLAGPAGFCYRITITNSGTSLLTNITVNDSFLGNLVPPFTNRLSVGQSDSHTFTTNHTGRIANTVTVTAQGGGTNVADQTSAITTATNLVPSLSCAICVTSPDDLDGNPSNCTVTLRESIHAVTYTVTVTNAGPVALTNLFFDAPQLPPNCDPSPFDLAPHTARTISCTVTQICTAVDILTVGVRGFANFAPYECAADVEVETACENTNLCLDFLRGSRESFR